MKKHKILQALLLLTLAIVVGVICPCTTALALPIGPPIDLEHNVGDVNLDGIINILDATAIQSHLAEYVPLKEEQLYNSDTDGNRRISISDVTRLQQFLAGIDVTLGKKVRYIAHRGYSAEAPENTLPAFQLAKEKGYEYIETDIQRTADGRYVLMHGSSMNSSIVQYAEENGTYIPIGVNALSLNTVKKYDVGRVNKEVSEKYKGTPVPTLEEGLSLCKSLGLKMYLEFKAETLYNHLTAEQWKQYVDEIIEIVRQYGMLSQVSFCSAQIEMLSYVKDVLPSVPLVHGTMNYGTGDHMKNLVASIAELKTSSNDVVIGIYAKNCQANSYKINEFVAECKKNGIRLGEWFGKASEETEAAIANAHPYVSEFTCNGMLPEDMEQIIACAPHDIQS